MQKASTTDSLPVVVDGWSGSGKGAFLANFAAFYEHRHPEARVLLHFVGATSASQDIRELLLRVFTTLQQWYRLATDTWPYVLAGGRSAAYHHVRDSVHHVLHVRVGLASEVCVASLSVVHGDVCAHVVPRVGGAVIRMPGLRHA